MRDSWHGIVIHLIHQIINVLKCFVFIMQGYYNSADSVILLAVLPSPTSEVHDSNVFILILQQFHIFCDNSKYLANCKKCLTMLSVNFLVNRNISFIVLFCCSVCTH